MLKIADNENKGNLNLNYRQSLTCYGIVHIALVNFDFELFQELVFRNVLKRDQLDTENLLLFSLRIPKTKEDIVGQFQNFKLFVETTKLQSYIIRGNLKYAVKTFNTLLLQYILDRFKININKKTLQSYDWFEMLQDSNESLISKTKMVHWLCKNSADHLLMDSLQKKMVS